MDMYPFKIELPNKEPEYMKKFIINDILYVKQTINETNLVFKCYPTKRDESIESLYSKITKCDRVRNYIELLYGVVVNDFQCYIDIVGDKITANVVISIVSGKSIANEFDQNMVLTDRFTYSVSIDGERYPVNIQYYEKKGANNGGVAFYRPMFFDFQLVVRDLNNLQIDFVIDKIFPIIRKKASQLILGDNDIDDEFYVNFEFHANKFMTGLGSLRLMGMLIPNGINGIKIAKITDNQIVLELDNEDTTIESVIYSKEYNSIPARWLFQILKPGYSVYLDLSDNDPFPFIHAVEKLLLQDGRVVIKIEYNITYILFRKQTRQEKKKDSKLMRSLTTGYHEIKKEIVVNGQKLSFYKAYYNKNIYAPKYICTLPTMNFKDAVEMLKQTKYRNYTPFLFMADFKADYGYFALFEAK